MRSAALLNAVLRHPRSTAKTPSLMESIIAFRRAFSDAVFTLSRMILCPNAQTLLTGRVAPGHEESLRSKSSKQPCISGQFGWPFA